MGELEIVGRDGFAGMKPWPFPQLYQEVFSVFHDIDRFGENIFECSGGVIPLHKPLMHAVEYYAVASVFQLHNIHRVRVMIQGKFHGILVFGKHMAGENNQ